MEQTRYLPVYLQIAEDVKSQILARDLVPGQGLPTENELARDYRVARATMRRALSVLEQEGLIIRRKSAGTSVAPDALRNGDLKADIAHVSPVSAESVAYSLDVLQGQHDVGLALRDLARGGHMLRFVPWNSEEPWYDMKTILFHKGIDGFILSRPRGMLDFVKEIAQARRPHVALETHVDWRGVNTVMPDDEEAAARLVGLLRRAGFQRLGFVAGALKAPELDSGYRRRWRGFLKGCSAHGVELDDRHVQTAFPNERLNPTDYSYLDRLCLELLSGETLPEVVILAHEQLVPPFFRAAAERGLEIPRELSIVTIATGAREPFLDNAPLNVDRLCCQPGDLARRAVDELMAWLRDPMYRPRRHALPLTYSAGATLSRPLAIQAGDL